MQKPFHPLTFWGLFTALAVGVIASDNALCAIAAIGGAAFIVYRRREEGPWRESFKWSLIAGALLIFIRALTGILIGVPRIGTTLFTLPRIALPTWLPGIRIGGAVTWERLSSSLHEGLMIATVIALFGAANSVTSPHKLLRVMPSKVYQLAVTLTIATSVFPQLISSIQRIRQAQFLRSGKKPRIATIAIPLLEESLERAVHLAESMEARGFGQSKRQSRYRPMRYSLKDLTVITSGISLAIAMVAL
ncbi:CbiQ ABC-type cobalt transport system, permease component CbiQ and related transporters [Candidatus Nanopelagicaceae bacterium]